MTDRNEQPLVIDGEVYDEITIAALKRLAEHGSGHLSGFAQFLLDESDNGDREQ